jgi:hypothetical protein
MFGLQDLGYLLHDKQELIESQVIDAFEWFYNDIKNEISQQLALEWNTVVAENALYNWLTSLNKAKYIV